MKMLGQILLGTAAGAFLALLFFGGLKATVDRLPHSRRPGFLFAASFVVRTVAAAAAMVLLLQYSLAAFAAAFLIFASVRVVLARLWRPDRSEKLHQAEGG